jgi:hypothetical protein
MYNIVNQLKTSTINGTTADGGVTITSGNSIASADIAGTTASAGTKSFSVQIGAGGGATIDDSSSISVDLIPYELFIAPTEILTVSAKSSTSADIGVSLNWTEDI